MLVVDELVMLVDNTAEILIEEDDTAMMKMRLAGDDDGARVTNWMI